MDLITQYFHIIILYPIYHISAIFCKNVTSNFISDKYALHVWNMLRWRKKETIWTAHIIEIPHLLQNPALNTEELLAGTEISTTPYFIDDSFFIDLKDEYESEQKVSYKRSMNVSKFLCHIISCMYVHQMFYESTIILRKWYTRPCICVL